MEDNILLVDDDLGSIELMGHILSGMGRLQFATNGADALRLAKQSPPDLVLLDAEMPGMSGFEVFRAFRVTPELTHVPVIFVSSHVDASFEVASFDLGAVDFIAKPVIAPLVQARVKTQLRIKQMGDALRLNASTDGLTGIANRRRFDEALEREWLLARRTNEPIALLMVDVDHFKRYNDRYGHLMGDACLQKVAQALLKVGLRPADLVARYGGEEFVLLLPQTSCAGAEQLAEHILQALSNLALEHADSPTAAHVSVSIGIAWHGAPSKLPSGRSANALLEAADQALYRAKHAGRARAHVQELL